jgi:adenylate cyclase
MQPSGTVTHLRPAQRHSGPSFADGVRAHLDNVLRSPQFDASARSRDFLCFIVEEALAGRGAGLSQTSIAMTVFGRTGDFDAVVDPIVRVQAGRLRRSLERYYLLGGDTGAMRIELPKGGYAPLFEETDVAHIARNLASRRTDVEPEAPDRPAIAVHSFSIYRAEDAGIASRLQDELMTELGRYGDLRVIRDHDVKRLEPRQKAAIRFELHCRLRREADEFLVSARLVDGATGEQLWSDEYHTVTRDGRWSCTIDDSVRIIAARVGSEQGVIARTLASDMSSRQDPTRTGDAIQRCYHFFFSRQISELPPAIEALERLTAREPENGTAWSYLARLYLVNFAFELTSLRTPIEKAISCAYNGVLLDPAGMRSRCVLAVALLVQGEMGAVRHEIDRALQLNSDALAYRELIGWLLALSGDWEQGMAILRDAMHRNPYCMPHVSHGQWIDHVRRGEYESAYLAALTYHDLSHFWREMMIACSLGHLGRITEARVAAVELLGAKPDFAKRGRILIGYFVKDPDLRARIVEGLRKAGLSLN